MLLLNMAGLGCSFSKITCEFVDVIEHLLDNDNSFAFSKTLEY